eukprot:5811146-Amphidinium_carterae.1
MPYIAMQVVRVTQCKPEVCSYQVLPFRLHCFLLGGAADRREEKTTIKTPSKEDTKGMYEP